MTSILTKINRFGFRYFVYLCLNLLIPVYSYERCKRITKGLSVGFKTFLKPFVCVRLQGNNMMCLFFVVISMSLCYLLSLFINIKNKKIKMMFYWHRWRFYRQAPNIFRCIAWSNIELDDKLSIRYDSYINKLRLITFYFAQVDIYTEILIIVHSKRMY